MRRFYIILSVLFLVCILIFIYSFVYLDSEKRRTSFYTVYIDDRPAGTIKIDRFSTEDKIIYRSTTSLPFLPIPVESNTKISLNRHYGLESYSRESRAGNAREGIFLQGGEDGLSSVSVFDSQFSCLIKAPARRETFVFEEASPVTYLPLIENYDFRKGRSQGFNAVTVLSTELPPMKRFVTFTSVRDERIRVDAKKIKTESLLVKIRNYPQSVIWVSKYDRRLVMLEIPSERFKIVRTFKPKALKAEPFAIKSDAYVSRDAVFKSGNTQLAGTFTAPGGQDAAPAVLLVWGDGPQDRDYQGIFTTLADYLTKEGFAVLRFDRRGIGASGGDFSVVTYGAGAEDISSALEYLARQKEVDPSRIALICCGGGAVYAPMVIAGKTFPGALVLMSPVIFPKNPFSSDTAVLKEVSQAFKWDDEYIKTVARSRLQTLEKIEAAKHDWAGVLGKRCFVGKMREMLGLDPADRFRKVGIPVLILHGRRDDTRSPQSGALIDRSLEEGGNTMRAMTYFENLGHLLASKVNEGANRIHYRTDPAVMGTVKNWLKNNLNAKTAAEPLSLTVTG